MGQTIGRFEVIRHMLEEDNAMARDGHLVRGAASPLDDRADHRRMPHHREPVLADHRILRDHLEAIGGGEVVGITDIGPPIGIWIVELDVAEALPPAAFELLAQVPLPARTAGIDLAFAVVAGQCRTQMRYGP